MASPSLNLTAFVDKVYTTIIIIINNYYVGIFDSYGLSHSNIIIAIISIFILIKAIKVVLIIKLYRALHLMSFTISYIDQLSTKLSYILEITVPVTSVILLMTIVITVTGMLMLNNVMTIIMHN